MSFDATLKTALEQPSPLIFYAVEIVLSSGTIRLLDGPGMATISGNSFTGYSSTWGTIANIDSFTDGIGAEAPTVTISFLPASLTAMNDLMDPAEQGASVKVWFGALNRSTGAVEGTPDLQFIGELDTTMLKVGQNYRVVVMECASVFERFFANVEGIGLNDATHQARFPGELGLEFVSLGKRTWPWGVSDLTRPPI